MKRLFALLFLIPALAFGAANDIQISQINAAGTAAVTHAFAPSSGTQFTTLAGWRTAQGLGAGDSPVFTGLTLSGLTAGRVPFVSTAGLLADASTFTFNSVTPALTVGNATFSGTTGSIGLTATGTNQSITLTPSGTGVLAIGNYAQINNAVGTSAAFGHTGLNNSSFAIYQDGNGLTAVNCIGSQGIAFTSGYFTIWGKFAPTTGNLLLGGLTTDDGVNVLQNPGATLSAVYKGGVQSLSGPGAANLTTDITEITTTGLADAISLANGTAGQYKTIVHGVDGGSFVLTATTKTGWSTFTSTVVGESITLRYLTTRGWIVVGSYLGTIAP